MGARARVRSDAVKTPNCPCISTGESSKSFVYRHLLNPHAPNIFYECANCNPGYQQARLSKARNPSTFAWIVAIFAVLVQNQMVLTFLDPCRVDGVCTGIQTSTVLSAASLVSIVIASSFVYRDIANLFARNMANLAYISLVAISVAWSIHPDITFQRDHRLHPVNAGRRVSLSTIW